MKFLFLFCILACEIKPYIPTPCEIASEEWSHLDGNVFRCDTNECVKWFIGKAENSTKACAACMKWVINDPV